jgi:predicted amidohydrolase
MFLGAVIQLQSTSDQEQNLATAEALITRAAAAGARLIATPENTNFLGPHEEKVRRAEDLEGPTCRLFSTLAKSHAIWLLLGSFNERSEETERCYNTSVLFAPDGSVVATYRKIHLFDVDVSDEVRFQESATIRPGKELVVAETELARLGLSICYDLRFPELYRHLGDRGAEILTVPSAFTATTGQAHWYPLLRARAIENQCWVMAPAQVGLHDDRGLRHSYGHSLIVDPWGQVVAAAGDGPGLALAPIDLETVERIRRSMPVRSHRRLSPGSTDA